MTLRPILRAYASACEDLLSIGHTLADEERSFLEYYVKELSRDLLSNNPTVETVIAESHKVNRVVGLKPLAPCLIQNNRGPRECIRARSSGSMGIIGSTGCNHGRIDREGSSGGGMYGGRWAHVQSL
jgi:hypothetical protein